VTSTFITGKRTNLVGLESREFIEGDLTDPVVCAQACTGVEIVFHEAALVSFPRSVVDPITTKSGGSRSMTLFKRNKHVVCFFRNKNFSKVVPLI